MSELSKRQARAATLLCMALFLAQPMQFGIWLSRISEVQSELGMSKSTLAFALLGMPVGLLPTLYFAGGIIDRIGVRSALLWVFPAMLVTGTLPGLAGSPESLFLGLMLLGTSFAFAEVGLNVFAAQTEKQYQITIMNRAHGFWSLGIMLGSLIGVQLANMNLPALQALVTAGCALLPVLLAISWSLPQHTQNQEQADGEPQPWRMPAGLIPVIIVVFGATLAEGAMSDWATVYMREAPWGGSTWDGLAVSVYAGMITLGRFIGDNVNIRLGPVLLARVCLLLAIFGVSILVLSTTMWMSFVGFGLVGLGVSAIFPLGVSATAQLSNQNQARNVSVMTFGALSGFLIGPPVIGLIAELQGLRIGISLLIPVLAISLLMSGRLVRR